VTAEEIRALVKNREIDGILEVATLEEKLLAEIAAQLADENQKLERIATAVENFRIKFSHVVQG
jgi:hypothetical protein